MDEELARPSSTTLKKTFVEARERVGDGDQGRGRSIGGHVGHSFESSDGRYGTLRKKSMI